MPVEVESISSSPEVLRMGQIFLSLIFRSTLVRGAMSHDPTSFCRSPATATARLKPSRDHKSHRKRSHRSDSQFFTLYLSLLK